MKKNIFLILVLFFVISIPSVLGFAGGNGSAEAPFEISTCEELQSIQDMFVTVGNYTTQYNYTYNFTGIVDNFILVNDVDCSDTVNWNGGAGFRAVMRPDWDQSPSAYFMGVLDGQGFAVHDVFMNGTGNNYTGIFGILSYGTIKNISFLNMTGFVTDSVNARGLITSNIQSHQSEYWNDNWEFNPDYDFSKTLFEDVVVTGSFNGDNVILGGVFGQIWGNEIVLRRVFADVDITASCNNESGNCKYYSLGGFSSNFGGGARIERSYVLGSVNATGFAEVGGLVGSLWGSSITDSYARNTVRGDIGYVGGLVGGAYPDDVAPVIMRSYATGLVIAGEVSKGNPFLGHISNDTYLAFPEGFNNFFNNETTGFTDGNSAFGLTIAAMRTGKPFLDAGWDFDEVWGLYSDINDGYPNLEVSGIPGSPRSGGGGAWPDPVEPPVSPPVSPPGQGAPLFALFGEQGDFVEWWNDLPWTKHLVWLFLFLLVVWLLSQQQKKKKLRGRRK